MRKLVKGGLCALALVCAFGLGRGGSAYSETDLARAREEAYNSGYHTGYEEGLTAEQGTLYEEAFAAGRTEGYDAGFSEGTVQGAAQEEEAVLAAVGDTYTQGYDTGYEEGYAQKEKDEQAARDRYVASLQPVLPTITPSTNATAPAGDTTAPETAGSTDPDNNGAQVTVYITNSGSKYHLDGCRHLKSKIQKTLEEAKALGLEPCKNCSPPK